MIGRLLLDLFRHGPARVLAGDASLGQSSRQRPAPGDVLPLDDINCLVKARHGWFLANRYDQYLGQALIRYGECCEIEHALLASLLAPGDCVVEVGANIGVHTVGLAKAVGPAGKVVAIEPQPAIFRVLCANLALNALANVEPHACGCGDGKTTLIAPDTNYGAPELHNSGGVSLAAEGDGIPIPVLPLDELTGNLPRLRLLKVDVEGMEEQVLAGAERLIAKHRPLLYVENDRLDKSKALIEWIQARNYRLWWHLPPLFNPANHFGIKENDSPGVVSVNMLCQPRERPFLAIANSMTEIDNPDRHPLKG